MLMRVDKPEWGLRASIDLDKLLDLGPRDADVRSKVRRAATEVREFFERWYQSHDRGGLALPQWVIYVHVHAHAPSTERSTAPATA